MKKITKHIPNALTSCNLLCGCASLSFAFSGMLEHAFWFIIASAVFDFLDGFAARMLKAYSNIGADLDSLADVVSFGVAPAAMVFVIMENAFFVEELPSFLYYSSFLAFFLAVFAALRLAKFNNDTRQTDSFIGLPTPAMALFFASFSLSIFHITESSLIILASTAAAIALFCWLMVSEIPMFSFKFKHFRFEENALRYLFAILAVIAIVFMGYAAPAVIVGLYIFTSLISTKSTN